MNDIPITTAAAVSPFGRTAAWKGLLVWMIGGMAMALLDGRVDLANLAMVLVLTAALASLWLNTLGAVLSGGLAVMAFNWLFVPPRGTFAVDLHQHALLLAALLLVNWIVAALMAGLRRQALQAQAHAWRAEQLRHWGDTLRDASDPQAHVAGLVDALQALAGTAATVMALKGPLPDTGNEDDAVVRSGPATADQWAGLWHCVRSGHALGPGTGRHEDQHDWYLPLRGRSATLGAALLEPPWPSRHDDALRRHAQSLCDQLGQALERARSLKEAAAEHERAQTQAVRNALLAAISHDYRTPLATILGAASSLEEQGARMDPAQRARMAHGIVEEAARLSRLTDNTLQLARLDAPGMQLRCDWESAEELVGAALRRARRHDPDRRVRARLEPDLPLVWCDALLVSQLLDNLLDNALKYSPAPAPVELLVQHRDAHLVLAVRDRGPGIAPAWRERVFDVFHRGADPLAAPAAGAAPPARSGAGVGLAVCRAIARAHGGELRLRPRSHGGTAFECWLPARDAPSQTENGP